MLNAVTKKITVKAYGTPVNNAFTLSFRRSITNSKTTVLLELVIDISKYTERIPLLLDTLLSELFDIEYNLRLDSTIFDDETRKQGIIQNRNLLDYTSGKEYKHDKNLVSEGIYKDNDRQVGRLYSKSEMGQLFDRRISIDTINNEMKKMEKTNESKVTFSISVENGKIKIKDVKISTIFCVPATITLQWKSNHRSYGTANVGNFCEVSHDVDTTVESPEITSENIRIESIITKLTEITEINATKFEEEKKNAAKVAAAEAEQVRKAAKETEIAAEAAANDKRRKDAEIKFNSEFTTNTSTTKEQLTEAIGKISQFTLWMSDLKNKTKIYDSDNWDEVVRLRDSINAAFLNDYDTEEKRKEITDSLKLCRQTYQTIQNLNEKKIFIEYFKYNMVADYTVRYRLQKYLELSDSDIEKYYGNEELIALWSKVIEYNDISTRD